MNGTFLAFYFIFFVFCFTFPSWSEFILILHMFIDKALVESYCIFISKIFFIFSVQKKGNKFFFGNLSWILRFLN